MVQTVTMLDCETGGLDHDENPITQIAMVNFDHDTLKVNWEWSSFLKPYAGLVINPIVYKKTTVTPQDVANGSTSKIVVKEMIKLFKQSNSSNGHAKGNTIIAGHNVIAFDRKFLEYMFLTEGHEIYEFISGDMIDTLTLAKAFWPKEKHNLTNCCKLIGYNLTGAHGALADTRATYEVYKHFVKNMRGGNSKQEKFFSENNTEQISNHRKHFNF